jgi:hypothetical protein
MNPESLSHWLGGLSLAARAKVLNAVAFELTIRVRSFSASLKEGRTDSVTSNQLIGVNELQHKILSQVGHYLDGEEKAYPVDVFSRILFELAEGYSILPALDAAITRTHSRISSPA